MPNAARKTSWRADLPRVPATVTSLDCQAIDTSKESWAFRASSDGGKLIAIRWEKLSVPVILSQRALHLVKLFLADKISRKKATTIQNDFAMFLRFQEWLGPDRRLPFDWSELTEGIARAFLAYGLEHRADKGNDYSRLRTFYRWGVARQHSDFDPALLRILQSITAIGNAKGHHVRFRDTTKGPFSPDELSLISGAVTEGRGSDQDRAVVMLHLELGHNPNATVRLRNKDFVRYQTKSAIVYQLDVPRVKKRTVRRETKRRPISAVLGRLLDSLQKGGPEALLFHWLSPTLPESDIRESMVHAPLDVRSVAASLKVSPTTLYKYGLNAEINAAERRQHENALLSGAAIEQRYFQDQIVQLKAELEKEQTRSKGLVGRIGIMEANAARLGFDPEEMYRPILKPVRTVSRAGANKGPFGKGFRRR
jgi:hypothetical protein